MTCGEVIRQRVADCRRPFLNQLCGKGSGRGIGAVTIAAFDDYGSSSYAV